MNARIYIPFLWFSLQPNAYVLVQIEGDTDRDYFLNPWEAKEYGLVDTVIDDGKPGLVAPIGDGTPPPNTKVWDFWKVEGTKNDNKDLPTEQSRVQNGYATPE